MQKGYLSFWAELKRRNLFRIAAAYAVVAWLFIQVADIVLPTFNMPDWVLQTIVVSAIAGFPLALVFAWGYELTPGGLMRSEDVLRQASVRQLTGRRLDGVIIGLLAAVVAFLVFDNYVQLEGESEVASDFEFPAREWVLLAGFDNQTSQIGLDRSLTAALRIGLGQSEHINVLPDNRLKERAHARRSDAQ